MKVETLCFSETLLYTYEYAWRHNPDLRHLHLCENLTFIPCIDQQKIVWMYLLHEDCLDEFITWNQFYATSFLCIWPAYVFSVLKVKYFNAGCTNSCQTKRNDKNEKTMKTFERTYTDNNNESTRIKKEGI
jgi:hypothetical protein